MAHMPASWHVALPLPSLPWLSRSAVPSSRAFGSLGRAQWGRCKPKRCVGNRRVRLGMSWSLRLALLNLVDPYGLRHDA